MIEKNYNKNCFSCKNTKTCKELSKWKKTTGWNLYELNEFFKLADMKPPFLLEYLEKSECFSVKSLNKDENYDMCEIVIENNISTSTSTLSIYDRHAHITEKYLIKPKSSVSTYKEAIVLLNYRVENRHLDKEVKTSINKDSLEKVFSSETFPNPNDNYIYNISFKSHNKKSYHIISDITEALRKKRENNFYSQASFDAYLVELNHEVSATSLMKTLIKDKLESILTDEILETLTITVEVVYREKVISKIVLDKNIITELKYQDDINIYTLYNTGELEISSIYTDLYIFIKNINDERNDYLSLKNDSFEFKYCLAPLKLVLTNMKNKLLYELE